MSSVCTPTTLPTNAMTRITRRGSAGWTAEKQPSPNPAWSKGSTSGQLQCHQGDIRELWKWGRKFENQKLASCYSIKTASGAVRDEEEFQRDWQNQRRELELAEVVKRLGEKMLDGDSLLQTNRQDAAHCDHILRSRINLLSSLHLSHVWEKGSLEVQYAWQDDPAKLSDNFGQAVRFTESEKRKLAKEGLTKEFNEKSEEFIMLGILEELSQHELDSCAGPSPYISIQDMLKPDHETTKLRLVIYSNLKCPKTGLSLNDMMMKGPNVLGDI